MRNASFLPLLFLSLSLAANSSAQSSARAVFTSSTPVILTAGSASNGCPVGFSVQRRSPGAVVWTNDRSQKHPIQGVQLTFSRPSAAQIVKADVVVHGTSGEARVIPAAGKAGDDLSQSFTLKRDDDSSTLPNRELWTETLATISFVELTEVEFANGVVWHEPHAGTCRAVPNGLLLVSGN
jgi:hypothetical protein